MSERREIQDVLMDAPFVGGVMEDEPILRIMKIEDFDKVTIANSWWRVEITLMGRDVKQDIEVKHGQKEGEDDIRV